MVTPSRIYFITGALIFHCLVQQNKKSILIGQKSNSKQHIKKSTLLLFVVPQHRRMYSVRTEWVVTHMISSSAQTDGLMFK
jgi:hypothetical protein